MLLAQWLSETPSGSSQSPWIRSIESFKFSPTPFKQKNCDSKELYKLAKANLVTALRYTCTIK